MNSLIDKGKDIFLVMKLNGHKNIIEEEIGQVEIWAYNFIQDGAR